MSIANVVRQYFLTIVLLFSGLFFSYSPLVNADENPIGQVIWVKGQASAGQPGQQRQLERRSPIYVHDVITTGVGSSGQVAFTDASMVTLRSDTALKIDQYYHQAGGSPSQEKSAMTLIKGGLRTITGAIPKANPDGYQMNTPVATIGVRGTDYTLFFSATQGLLIKLDVGAIIVTNQGGALDLNKSLAKVYGVVSGLGAAPTQLSKEPAVFHGQPSIIPVSPGTINSISTSPTGGNVPGMRGPSGPAKTVSSFCVGLLKDLSSYFTRYFG